MEVHISHSQDFMNDVCISVVNTCKKNLSGTCDQYVRTWPEVKENQMKRFHREQNQIAYMKNYAVWLSHGGAKLIQQTHSKEKTL